MRAKASSRGPSSTARATAPTGADPRTLSRRGGVLVGLLALLLSFRQSPGRISPDTKLDLTADPLGFLARAAHLWAPDAPMGQVQNQAYGYFFPHGAFFALGDLLTLPGWVTQRLWWALLLTVGFIGVVRLAEALRIGSFPSRLLAGTVFVLAPRVLTTLGTISSETLPMMLAPWVLLPIVRALDACSPSTRPLWQEALRSAFAVALMGAVNAVATAAAAGIAALWLLTGMFAADRAGLRRRLRFTGWWLGGLLLACLWWLVPLLMLSRISPPFLDFIESSRVTTQWTSLTEVLRGTDSWTPFVSAERAAGAVLVSEPAAVIATGLLAAAGLAGLAMSRMPFRGRLLALLAVGLLALCLGYPGTLGSPIAEQVRAFLDGAGAPLRNVHKFDPLLRLPLALGLAHLLAKVPLPLTAADWRAVNASTAAQRQVATAMMLTVATLSAGTLAWAGGIAGDRSYRAIPDYWQQTADWIAADQQGVTAPARTLVVPGAPFADQLWGLTRDEPLQPLAETPWAVRDAIPLTPPGAIRAMDAVQRDLAAGHGSPGLAPTLAAQGVGYLVLRTDLDPRSSRSARPLMVAQALRDSPGISVATTFGPDTAPPAADGFVVDNGLRPALPAITVYRVDGATGTGPRLTELADMPRIVGGAESLAAINRARARAGLPALPPALLHADAQAAGLGDGGDLIVTDTPANREVDFGRVDDHASALRTADDPRLTKNAVADYPVDGQERVQAQWLLDNEPGGVRVQVSGSAADATQPGQTSPATSAAAAFDGDPDTAWVSRGLESAVGQTLTVELAEPVRNLAVTLTTAGTVGADVTTILVTTDAGSAIAQGVEPGEQVRIVAPSAPTRRVEIRALETDDGGPGNQFALAQVELSQILPGGTERIPLAIRQAAVLPELTAAAPVSEWVLSSGLSGRGECVTDAQGLVRCAPALGLTPEDPGLFSRTLSVPAEQEVIPAVVLRPKPGGALNNLLAVPGRITATGPSGVTDVRGSTAAMVDGDPNTTWTAPEPTSRKAAQPTLTVRLPDASRVSGLRLHTRDGYPAAPTEVEVNLGSGKQKVKVGADGAVPLKAAVTDEFTIKILKTEDLLDTNDLGFTTRAPAGISELEVLGAPAIVPVDDDRPVRITCATDPAGPLGLGLSASGRLIRLQLETTAGALRRGEPALARPCPGEPLELAAGRQEISVNPGRAFTVDEVILRATESSTPAAVDVAAPEVTRWDATSRSVVVPAADAERVLSIPESTNPGWRARLNGTELEPVIVDGWQQGWLVPAGAAGTVVLDFPLDTPYRWVLLVGLLLVALLLVLAIWPTRRQDPPPPSPSAPGPRRLLLATVAAVGVGWLLTGWWGLLIGLAAYGLTGVLARRGRVVTAFGAMALAAAALAAGPWQSGLPYTGYDLVPQLAAFVAVAVAISSTLVEPGRFTHRLPRPLRPDSDD